MGLTELQAIAQFLELPESKVAHLTAQLFDAPAYAEDAIHNSGEADSTDMIESGLLVEQSRGNIILFEEALARLSFNDCEIWKKRTTIWTNSEVVHLAQLGVVA